MKGVRGVIQVALSIVLLIHSLGLFAWAPKASASTWINAKQVPNSFQTLTEYGGGTWMSLGYFLDYHLSTDTTTWTEYNLGLALEPSNLKYLNSTWYLAGSKGVLRTTTPQIPSSWAPVHASLNNTLIQDMVYNPAEDRYVMVGGDRAYSYIGNAAPAVVFTGSSGLDFYRLAYGDGVYVATTYTPDQPSRVYRSVDAVNWNLVYTAPSVRVITDIVYGNNKFVAVGDEGKAYVSSDGVAWTQNNAVSDNSIALNSVIFAAGQFYTAGQREKVAVSTDGLSWQEDPGNSGIMADYADIAVADGKAVAAGYTQDFTTGIINTTTLAAAPAVNSVIVTPSTASVVQGSSEQLTVTVDVSGGAVDTVTWSSSDLTGNVSVSNTGLVTVSATATSGPYTITATSTEDSSKHGTATITVTEVPAVPVVNSVTVTPATASVVQGASEQLTATVSVSGGAADTVTWSSSDLAGNVSVSNTGLVTVSATATPGPYTITATSTEDSSKHGTATITVTEAPAVNSVIVTPSTASVVQGSSEQLTATVNVSGGAVDTVTWSSSDLTGNVSVSSTGLVTVSATATPGPYTITATSTEDNSKQGTSTITVTEAPAVNSVIVTPSTASVVQGASEQLTATVNVSGGAADTVTWSSSDPAGKVSVSNTGLVTVSATATPGPYTITATSTEDNSKRGTATITVTAAPVVPVEYTVHIANQAGGTITASPTTAVAGVPITVSVVPEAGKRLQPGSLKYIFDSGVFPISKGTFIMPAGDVTVTAEFEDIREQTPELIIAAPMFEQVRAGYARPAPRPLLMTNVGNTVAVIESVYSSDSDSFELHTGAIHVGVGETIDSWTIQPIAGLIAGTYSTVVSAVYGEGSIVTAAITFVVQPRRSGGSSSEGGDSTTPAPNTPGSNDPSPAEPLPNGVPVLVNGRAENIGTLDTTTVNNQTITTITPDPAKLLEWLEREGNNAVVTIPVHVVSEMTTAVLSGDIAQQLADRSAVLVFTTPSASYQLSASQLPIGDIAVDLGAEASLADVVFKLTITKANLEEKNLLQAASNQAGASWLLDPVHFTVTATYKNTTVDINRFSSYVRRDLLIPDTVDPKQITTGVVVGGDGSIHHVPTYVRQQDSQYYAVINSLTNSMYSLVWHPVTFADTVNHWAENAISDMGSRMIVTGVAPDKFEPTRYITRAEFAAMVVRALGLTPGKGDTTFTDVQASQWFAGYVQTAREYQLIEGYEDGRFAPQDHITREQAMTIISKAMILTGIQTTASKKQIEAELASFEDQSSIAGYARAHIAANLSHNIAKGRSASTLAPKGQITRAEVAQLLQNLLQKSELIQ